MIRKRFYSSLLVLLVHHLFLLLFVAVNGEGFRINKPLSAWQPGSAPERRTHSGQLQPSIFEVFESGNHTQSINTNKNNSASMNSSLDGQTNDASNLSVTSSKDEEMNTVSSIPESQPLGKVAIDIPNTYTHRITEIVQKTSLFSEANSELHKSNVNKTNSTSSFDFSKFSMERDGIERQNRYKKHNGSGKLLTMTNILSENEVKVNPHQSKVILKKNSETYSRELAPLTCETVFDSKGDKVSWKQTLKSKKLRQYESQLNFTEAQRNKASRNLLTPTRVNTLEAGKEIPRWTCLPPEPRSTLKSSDTPDVCRCNSIDVFWSAFNAEQADLRNHTDLSDDHCTYYNNTRTVVCSGSQVIEVPTLKTLIEEVNTMIFDETNIKCLEEQAATERLPKSRGLGFTNGALSEIKPGFLAEIRTNELTLSNNSLSEWNFSWFASENSSNITSINLAQNFIQFLPNPEVGPEFVLPHLNTLTLSDNPLLVIPPDLFKPLTHSPVKCLGLRNCCLENFGKDDNNNITSSLKFLRHLESLDLSNNPRLTSYKLSRFLSPLRGRRLHTLVLSGNGYVTVPYSALETVSSSLENLDLHSSSFSCLDNSSFPYLPRLRILNLDFSRISSLLPGTFDSTPNLESLSLQSNHFLNIPPALRLPTLKELNFKGNPRIEDEHEECAFLLENDSFRGMTGLEYLNLAETPLQHIYTGQFLGMRSLQSLTLTRCLIRTIEPGAFATLENLHALYLNSNLLELLDNNSFSGLHNLTILNLNDNDITLTRPYPSPVIPLVASEVQSHKKSVERYNGERYDEQSGEKENYLGSETSFSTSPRPFSMLKKLQKLFLASNRIGELIPVFDDLESLTFLDLKRNVVYDWTKRVLQFNLNLSKLDLEDNRLTSFTDAMIQDFNNENLIEINIKMNSFICSCSLYDAQEKLNSENFVDYEGYTCTVEDTFPEEHRLFTDDPGDCSPEAPDDSKSSKTSNVFLVVASIGLVTTALAAAFVFRRKRLRNGDSIDAKREEIQTKISYQYDVFICYAATDKKWVFNTLLPVFENTFGLQVCVHERDFEPGDMIVENISSSISKSRKVLFVVSPASISSHWCRLELDYTRVSSVNEGTNKLIMLQKEAVPPEDQPQNLRHILNTRTYIEWTEDSRVQALAWTKLRRVLTKQRGSAKPGS